MEIIRASKDHICDLSGVHLASKLVAEEGIVDPDYLASFSQAGYEAKWSQWVSAEESQTYIGYVDNTPVGLVSFGKLRTPPAGTSKIRPLYSSEIYAIYIHPDYFQKGYGRILMSFAAQELMAQNHKSMCLWAIEKNKRACAFYNALGGARVGKQVVEMGCSHIKEACYAWRNLSVISGR